jgi:ABC-type molybdate transport system substrate-binding protein
MLVNAGLLAEILPNIETMPGDEGAIVSLVESGSVDAAIVYVSDVSETGGHDVTTVVLASSEEGAWDPINRVDAVVRSGALDSL